jgi:hypothetical protein
MWLAAGATAAASTCALADAPILTVDKAKEFLTAAGLQTCEVSDLDPMVTKISGAVASLSLGVAVDCAAYDPSNPTLVNVHQFADAEARDAMVASLQSLQFRALRAYGDVWAIDDYVLVLLGPQRKQVEAMIKAEYRRRHPETN